MLCFAVFIETCKSQFYTHRSPTHQPIVTLIMYLNSDWDSCEEALTQICPGVRGHGFNGCLDCVDANRPAVVKACGNFTDEDKMHPGFPVHYYCGIGWPENLMCS